jgi:hypothetical protein
VREYHAVDKFVDWDPAQRKYIPRGWNRSIVPAWLGFDPAITPGIYTVAAAGAISPPTRFAPPYGSAMGADEGRGTPFLVTHLLFEAGNVPAGAETTTNADFTVNLFSTSQALNFMNRPVHVRTIFGAAQLGPNVGILPAKLREPYMFPSNYAVTANFVKNTGAALAMRMYMVGKQYYPWAPDLQANPSWKKEILKEIDYWMERRRYVTPYWLTTDLPVNLLANGTGEFFSKIGDDGHCEVYAITAVSTGNFALEISEVKTKQTLMSGLITQTNGIGTNLFPTLFPTPYLIPAGYKLRFQITDLSGLANSIFITLQARKIYAPLKNVRDVIGPDARVLVSTKKVPARLTAPGVQ